MSWTRSLGSRTRHTALGRLSRNQLAVAAVAAVVICVVNDLLQGSPLDLPACGLLFAVFAAGTLTQRWGLPLADWAPKWLAYRLRAGVWVTPAAGAGVRNGRRAEAMPAELGDLSIVAQGDVGLVRDADRKTLTAVARVDLQALGLLDPDRQARPLETFARLLNDLSREPEDFRLGLIKRIVPCRTGDAAGYVAERALDVGSVQARSSLEAVDASRSLFRDHEFHVAMRMADGPRLVDRLERATDFLERSDVAIRSDRPLLDESGMARLVGDCFDPFRRGAGGPWPHVTRDLPDRYETDDACHATFWVKDWPVGEVGPGWLRPLVFRCDVPALSLAVVLGPEDRGHAHARLRRMRTRRKAWRSQRVKYRQEERPEDARQDDDLERVQIELKAGSPWWWEAYLTVSARDDQELAMSVERVRSACSECELTPVLLKWVQADAFTNSLPLCRGLEPAKGRL